MLDYNPHALAAYILAHLSQDVFYAPEGERRGHQDRARTAAARQQQITLDICTQAVTPAKRAAQTKVVEMIVPKPKEQKEREETVGKARIPLSNPSEPTPSRAVFISA